MNRLITQQAVTQNLDKQEFDGEVAGDWREDSAAIESEARNLLIIKDTE